VLKLTTRFQTYFPHVDNIYSHRSTQRYKRKPFVSHYWDCRLKGRPPGTPKTDDPGKRKRRRTARQRDLCDVKIKITEYFPGAAAMMAQSDFGGGTDANGMEYMEDGREPPQPFGVLAPSATLPAGHPGAGGARYYTIQRVNGGGSNGKENDGTGSGHKHTLEESDAIKKNSVQRMMLKEQKEKRKTEVSTSINRPCVATPQQGERQLASLMIAWCSPHMRRRASVFFASPRTGALSAPASQSWSYLPPSSHCPKPQVSQEAADPSTSPSNPPPPPPQRLQPRASTSPVPPALHSSPPAVTPNPPTSSSTAVPSAPSPSASGLPSRPKRYPTSTKRLVSEIPFHRS
jgi:hypothetical protein